MINILLFAHLQEAAGKERITLDISSTTVKELLQLLKSEYNLQGLNSVMVAINEEYALEDDTIKNGDTVALIPPVSGG
ncbi:molybdopterin converting factor subunit 1 [Bacillus sp. HMF5848]|uniref:molybdopterin converting factor subunit 1 n=1 Tax=Bacillus sp. HMF5848 TaxID=2495421 RepID=UPI000F7B446E|nr:molybdopterin converting factor subunit 1 [Bacillus sp. HMF5848]RSK27942.1 molybdopterin converting factor subunit 1 [Bacillus sp. HMF5848]